MENEIREIRELAEKNYELILKNTVNIDKNLERINQNSYTLEILRDYKKDARRWFVAFVIMSVLFIAVCIHHFLV